ncbi:hypothetical protein E3N88_01709 [Mikania micrantha]|uniref:CCHC-type domain-containing protein n=1 Tax=Mikania micrantha TaxID=192012 RepID=A0A5N6Q2B9_9ASTR|nr:hypothetical protein E3N88_01709 [Mikania micrantha]
MAIKLLQNHDCDLDDEDSPRTIGISLEWQWEMKTYLEQEMEPRDGEDRRCHVKELGAINRSPFCTHLLNTDPTALCPSRGSPVDNIDNIDKLMLTRHDNNSSHGRRFGNRGRGRGRSNYQYKGEGNSSYESGRTDHKAQRSDDECSTSNTNDKTQITCYRCQKLGHYSYDCPNKKHVNVESLFVEMQDDELALLMCQVMEEKIEN